MRVDIAVLSLISSGQHAETSPRGSLLQSWGKISSSLGSLSLFWKANWLREAHHVFQEGNLLYSKQNKQTKNFTATFRLVFDHVTGCRGLAKWTHKINQHKLWDWSTLCTPSCPSQDRLCGLVSVAEARHSKTLRDWQCLLFQGFHVLM